MSLFKLSFPTLVTLSITLTSILSRRSEFAEHVNTVNSSPDATWVAALHGDIDYDDDVAILKRSSGSLLTELPEPVAKHRPRMLQTASLASAAINATSYPASLDLRTAHPNCPSIAKIRNQGICSSCWAFASMNSVSDRHCIKTNTTRYFAPQDSMECCPTCAGTLNTPCNGGFLYQAFLNARNAGVVSGDAHDDQTGVCKPYFLADNFIGVIPKSTCGTACTANSTSKVYAQDKLTIKDFTYGVGANAMIKALNEGGSIAATIMVYSDLWIYKSGIYFKKTGAPQGNHAVRVVGYGSENGVNYWIIANTWGSSWGENGFFRLRRGTNEGGIETNYFFAASV